MSPLSYIFSAFRVCGLEWTIAKVSVSSVTGRVTFQHPRRNYPSNNEGEIYEALLKLESVVNNCDPQVVTELARSAKRAFRATLAFWINIIIVSILLILSYTNEECGDYTCHLEPALACSAIPFGVFMLVALPFMIKRRRVHSEHLILWSDSAVPAAIQAAKEHATNRNITIDIFNIRRGNAYCWNGAGFTVGIKPSTLSAALTNSPAYAVAAPMAAPLLNAVAPSAKALAPEPRNVAVELP